ncbi:MAG: protein-disulfide reductase DsbD domain-containing protein, partial [Myxococcota bacterium]
MRSLYSLFLIAALMVSGLAYAQPKNLVNLQPSAAQLTTDQTAPVQVILTVPPGFHVYRDMLQVDVVDPDGLTLGPPDFPPGLMKTDPANPANQREQYDLDVIVDVPATAKTAGTYNPTFSVRFQACKDTLCFMPKTQEITIPVTVSAGQRSGFRFDEKQDVLLVNSVGGTSAKHSRRPDVDFSSLPSSAAVRPEIGDTPHPVLARLIADKQTVAPGDTVRLGVHLEQAEGWHTYWRSPGEIGKPPEIAWGLPGDATASAHVFPIPHRYDEQDIVSYGYDHENMLFADVVIPDNLSTGEHTVQAKVKWLVCEKQCIPGNADLKLPLTVADATSESPFASLFDHYADKHPAPAGQIDGVKLEIGLDKPAVGSEMSFQATILVQPEDGRSVTLKQDAGTWPGFAPIIEGSFMVDDVHIQQVDDGSVVINIKA